MQQWKYGDKKKLAEMVGISQGRLGHYLNGRSQVPLEMAKRISYAASQKPLGYHITVAHLRARELCENPLIKTKVT